MFKGLIIFAAWLKGNRLTFSKIDFNPNEPGVTKVELEGLNGNDVQATVHLDKVATKSDGHALARKVLLSALNRIAYLRNVAIGEPRQTSEDFVELDQPPNSVAVEVSQMLNLSGSAEVVANIDLVNLIPDLAQKSLPGEKHFGLFRSAQLSTSPVEEFMNFYQMLLMLFDEEQSKVDKFIIAQEPGVVQTPDPRQTKNPKMETTYTRLRNEFAHTRANVDLNTTKSEMADLVGALRDLTKQAIQSNP